MSKKRLTVIADDEALISLKHGSRMLGLSVSAIRQGKAGTERLTKIPQGRKLFLIKSEVLEHRRRLIESARKTQSLLNEIAPQV